MRRTDSYMCKKLDELHTRVALRELLTKANLSGQWHADKTYARHKPLYIYDNIGDIDTALSTQHTLSAVLLSGKDNGMRMDTYVCVKRNDAYVDLHAISWGIIGEYYLGVWYAYMTVSRDSNYFIKINGDKNIYDVAHDFVIITSCLIQGEPMSNDFAAFTRNWMVRQQNGEYHLPGLLGNCFYSYINI